MYVRTMRPKAFTIRMVLFLSAWSMRLCGTAQDKGSLTDDFPGLSAKERARIAAKENADAAKDVAYQAVMQRSEQAFREGRYEDALQGYQEARGMRPYNVFPKVKCEDLRVLIAKRAAQADTVPPVVEVPVPAPTLLAPPPVVEAPQPPEERPLPATPPAGAEVERQPDPSPQVIVRTGPVEPEQVERRPAPTARSVEPAPVPLVLNGTSLPDGITERQYREGKAFTIERTVTEQGHSTVYKRVAHPYATFFFEDGVAVDERVWNTRFQGK